MQNWYAPPLASARAAGVAAWDPHEIADLLVTGAAPRGMAMGPMAEVVYRSTQNLSAEDAQAIATYLHALSHPARAASAAAPTASRTTPATAASARQGAAIYDEHCAACHGGDGRGAFPAYPALAGNPGVTEATPANAVHAVLSGGYAPATRGNPRPYGMPPFARTLGDADIAAVLTYIRSAWGNAAPAVSTLDVARFR